MNEGEHNAVTNQRTAWCVAGMVLFVAVVASWFVWGPVGIIAYVGGLFNSLRAFVVMWVVGAVILVAAVYLPVLAVFTALRWRRLAGRERRLRLFMVAVCAALVASFAVGFTGAVPSPFDMYVKGFARYAERRTDVEAIQSWLSTLDPNEYVEEPSDPTGIPVSPAEQPKAITRLHPNRHPYGVRVLLDDAGRPMVRLLWGGGFIGHWGIVVGHREMKVPQTQRPVWVKRQVGSRTEELCEYGEYRKPLAPGAYIWAELE